MSDSLGDGTGNPTETQINLYERWAKGGTALSLIGEVQASPHYPEKPGNLVLTPESDKRALEMLAQRGSTNGAHIWPQLGHAGALSHAPISTPKGPSALDIEGLKCDGMSIEEIHDLPETFANAATIARDVGFGGVMIHAGHGFLLSQFLSPLFNHRSDHYGGTVDARFRIVAEVIDSVRLAVGANFPVSIRINSTDKLEGGLSNDDALHVVKLLDQTSIDLIDISGGTYFPGAASSSDGTSASGPYFSDFARRAKQLTSTPITLTGGFKTREQATAAINGGITDAISLARAMVIDPSLANTWLSEAGGDPQFPVFDAPSSGGVTAWYSMRLTALGDGTESQFNLSPEAAIDIHEARDAERCDRWKRRFA